MFTVTLLAETRASRGLRGVTAPFHHRYTPKIGKLGVYLQNMIAELDRMKN